MLLLGALIALTVGSKASRRNPSAAEGLEMGKTHRVKSGQHVQLLEWFQEQAAWATMKPGPRALYIELKRRYRGGPKAEVKLSQRDAAKALNTDRGAVANYFKTLIERGFIALTLGHHLGAFGKGVPATFRLTELPHEGAVATKDFTKWKPSQNLKSPPENPATPAGKTDHPGRKT